MNMASLIFVLIILITKASAQPSLMYQFCINDKGNYTNSSAYQTNLRTVLSALPSSNGNGFGFYNLSSGGEGPNRVNAIGLCRGDVGHEDCLGCLKNATGALPEICPNQKEAVGWYEICMLRYSNRSLYGSAETFPKFYMWNLNNVTDSAAEGFFAALQTLLDGLKNRAKSGGPLRKFATGNASAPGFLTVYGMVQCTPDLSSRDCNNCLDDAFGNIPICCDRKIGGRVIGPSCSLRYETYQFYQLTDEVAPAGAPPPSLERAPTSLVPPPNTSDTSNQGNGSNTSKSVIIGVVSSAFLSVVLVIFVCVYLRIRRKNKRIKTRPSKEPVEEIESAESLQYSFETIRIATDSFSEENKLGEGGFGPVYKGSLSNGQEIAVKRLSTNSGQGELEFKNEVMLVARLQHRNLVRLLGFCLEGSERLLIYEFVPNASLDHFVFDPRKREDLNWSRRYKIIEGIARGLLYLHEDSRLRIIHRDLKASNILLDEEMHPKISDFGLARLFHVDQTQGNTSRIVGTYGYMAPEYAMHGQFSVKSDVFSFGVLLLEIVSGQRNNCFRHEDHQEDLLSYTWRNWNAGTASSIVDPLVRHGQGSEITRCIHIALLCVQENVAHRPTMNAIVLMLNSNSLSLPMPSEPAFFMQSSMGPYESTDFDSRVTDRSELSKKGGLVASSSNEITITDLYPR